MRKDSDGLENSKAILDQVKVVYEDGDMVVVDKPAGLSVHGDGIREQVTLVDWIMERYPEMQGVGEEAHATNGKVILRPGIVHRLDKETSGILVLAKHADSHAHLKKQFHDRLVQKEYMAFVYGAMEKEVGTIDTPIGKSVRSFRRKATGNTTGVEREARTEYEVRERFSGYSGAPSGYTWLTVKPKTGRTHQIRVHLLSIGHPIVCDGLYVPHRACPLEMGRMALHAERLTITLFGGEKRVFQAEIPEDMANFLQYLRERE